LKTARSSVRRPWPYRNKTSHCHPLWRDKAWQFCHLVLVVFPNQSTIACLFQSLPITP
jgi:hypothetical protein